MLHFALIGEKLGHSLSVPIHQAIFRIMGISADYRLVEIPRSDFATQATRLIHEVDGFNITIPYKQEIMALLDDVDARAAAIGAVNTVTVSRQEGQPVTCGHNTDVLGFKAMLRHFGILPQGQPCYCLGTGGAAKAVVAALEEMGAASVTLVSRHPAAGQISYEELARQFSGGILVNSTPSGMWPAVEGCPLSEGQLAQVLAKASGVADLIFNPAETVLTKAARAYGVPACTGLYMLIDQAVEAEKLWLNRELPSDLTMRLMQEIHL